MIGFLLLLLFKNAVSDGMMIFKCDSCSIDGSSVTPNQKCWMMDCKCYWCTSSAMCTRLVGDAQMLDTQNDTDKFIKSISEQIQYVCQTNKQKDWTHYVQSSEITCGKYLENINANQCNKLVCKMCPTNLICDKVKTLIENVTEIYSNSSANYRIGGAISNYCSSGFSLGLSFLPLLFTFYLL